MILIDHILHIIRSRIPNNGFWQIAAIFVISLYAKQSIAQETTPHLHDIADSTHTHSDHLFIAADSTANDTIHIGEGPKEKSDIATTIFYKAEDSMRFNVRDRTMLLYNMGDVTYGDINLSAAEVKIDYATNIVEAYGLPDSTGERLYDIPVFTDKGMEYNSDSMSYNFKTKKGVISGIVTKQGEGYLIGTKVKKTASKALYVRDAKYTTCNLAHPHFAINARKLKTEPGKYLVSGPFHMELNGVPTPIGFIFGMFPVPKSRSSGIIVPTYGEAADRGFYLRNGGLYLALNDYVGLKLLGEAYTIGGWGTSLDMDYRKRYGFTGNLFMSYKYVVREEQNLSQTIEKDYWLQWRHSPISQGSSRFSANVNLGSTTYNQNNSFNVQNYLSSSFNSNISYSKNFVGSPFSMGVNMRHNQNVQTGIATLFPEANLSMTRIYPLKKKGSSKRNALTKANFSYGFNTRAEITNTPRNPNPPFKAIDKNGNIIEVPKETEIDTLPFFEHFGSHLKGMRYGGVHRIPVSTTFTINKYFQVTPNLNYTENWNPYKLNYTWVEADTAVQIDTIQTLGRSYEYNYGANLSTRLYSFYYLKSKKIPAIKHMITPTVGYSYKPDFSTDSYGFYQTVQVDSSGRTERLSRFSGAMYGPPGVGESGNVNFGLSNQIEMKILDGKDSTGATYQKSPVLQNLDFRSSYNLLADSFQLAPISFTGRTTILKRLSVNVNGVIDPYTYRGTKFSEDGKVIEQRRFDEFAWNTGGGIGSLTSLSLNLGTNLAPPQKKKKADKDKLEQKKADESLSLEEQQMVDDIRNNPFRYVDFDIPWSLSVNYNLRYVKQGLLDPRTTETMSFSGDVSLTAKWKIQITTGYDFEQQDFSFTSIGIFRDLHCWQLSANWIPFGPRQSYNFDISVKASMLQDLKLSRRNSWYDR